MADATTLFLLTTDYPLATGEEFIENEIAHLARRFERIIVVATQTAPGDVITRQVPENVSVLTAGKPRPTGAAMAPVIAEGLRHLPRNALGRRSVDPRVLALDALFEGRARRTADELLAQLPGLRLEPGSHAVVYSFWFHVPARVAIILADDLRARGVVVDRLVSRAYRYDLYENEAKYQHIPQRRVLLDAFDAVCPVSDQGSRALLDSWPGYSAKVRTRHLGTVDPGETVRCSREPFRIISCSRLADVKRMDRMPAILAGLRAKGVYAVWTHMGDGPGMPAVRDAVRAAGVEDFVDLRGHVPNAQVIDLERELRPSCLINLSISEGLPVSMMEAGSLGIPVVATDVGGVAEIVHDRGNGRLLPADFTDAQAIEALAWLAGLDQDSYDEVCTIARRSWESGFDQAVVYPAFCSEVLGVG